MVKKKKQEKTKTEKSIKKPVKAKKVKTEKNIKTKKQIKAEKDKRYWEYFSMVMFLVFSTLFISMLIIEIFYVLGKKAIWITIPLTAIFWGLSYLLARVLFKKK